jgi:glycosyltransferase involved in cell wall biosynthesis
VFDVALLMVLYRFFRREHITVMHAFSSTAEFFGGIAARLRGCHVIVSIRNHNERLPRLHRWAKRFACVLADAVVANSHSGAAAAVAAGVMVEQKVHVVPNGVAFQPLGVTRQAARAQLGIPNEAFIVLSVGRLVGEKNYDATLELARRMSVRHAQALFLIAGDGPLRSSLAQQIDVLHLGGQVRLLGERRDIPLLLATADLYLNTSVSEGLSNSIMEAMAAGLPVLATSVGGTTELIEEGKTGLLFSLGNIVGAEQKLAHLVVDATLRKTLGRNARQAMQERYSVESMVTRIEQVYRSLSAPPTGWKYQEASRHAG